MSTPFSQIGSIYFVSCPSLEMVKIGHSIRMLERVIDLQRFSPAKLELLFEIPGSKHLERNIHNCFADLHSHCEWFFMKGRLRAAMDRLQAGETVDTAIDLADVRGNVIGLTARATRKANLEWAAAKSGVAA